LLSVVDEEEGNVIGPREDGAQDPSSGNGCNGAEEKGSLGITDLRVCSQS